MTFFTLDTVSDASVKRAISFSDNKITLKFNYDESNLIKNYSPSINCLVSVTMTFWILSNDNANGEGPGGTSPNERIRCVCFFMAPHFSQIEEIL